MKKLNKLAVAVALAASASATSQAGTFQAVTSESVGVESATTSALITNIAGNTIVATAAASYTGGNARLTLTLDNGATFNDATYTLEESAGGGTGDLSHWNLVGYSKGDSSIEFRLGSSSVSAGDEFILSGSSVAGQAATFKMPAANAGTKISIVGSSKDLLGTIESFSKRELFRFANELSAGVDTVADATVDVNDNRLTFTGGAKTDTIALEFVEAGLTNGLNLTDADKVLITLSGDMSTISSLKLGTDGTNRGDFTIDADAGIATFSASASDVFAASSTVLTATVYGSGAIATRDFTVKADVDLETETDKNVIAADTSAGKWDINGLQAKVAQLSLNYTGFVSWLKIANEGATSAQISADIIYTLADGTEGAVNGAALGSVDAGGIVTIGEAAILAALGNPTQGVNASMTVTVAGQTNVVHITAEKKASDGRVAIPVYYDDTRRSWFQ